MSKDEQDIFFFLESVDDELVMMEFIPEICTLLASLNPDNEWDPDKYVEHLRQKWNHEFALAKVLSGKDPTILPSSWHGLSPEGKAVLAESCFD